MTSIEQVTRGVRHDNKEPEFIWPKINHHNYAIIVDLIFVVETYI